MPSQRLPHVRWALAKTRKLVQPIKDYGLVTLLRGFAYSAYITVYNYSPLNCTSGPPLKTSSPESINQTPAYSIASRRSFSVRS